MRIGETYVVDGDRERGGGGHVRRGHETRVEPALAVRARLREGRARVRERALHVEQPTLVRAVERDGRLVDDGLVADGACWAGGWGRGGGGRCAGGRAAIHVVYGRT